MPSFLATMASAAVSACSSVMFVESRMTASGAA